MSLALPGLSSIAQSDSPRKGFRFEPVAVSVSDEWVTMYALALETV